MLHQLRVFLYLSFLNRTQVIYDTVDYGRWIIPAVRAEAERRARSKALKDSA